MDGKRVKAKRKRRRLKQEAPLRERLLKMAAAMLDTRLLGFLSGANVTVC
jgi:hypothetical protein